MPSGATVWLVISQVYSTVLHVFGTFSYELVLTSRPQNVSGVPDWPSQGVHWPVGFGVEHVEEVFLAPTVPVAKPVVPVGKYEFVLLPAG